MILYRTNVRRRLSWRPPSEVLSEVVMVRNLYATRWEADMPTASRAWTTPVTVVGCAADFGLEGLGGATRKQRSASPSITARPPEEFLP